MSFSPLAFWQNLAAADLLLKELNPVGLILVLESLGGVKVRGENQCVIQTETVDNSKVTLNLDL